MINQEKGLVLEKLSDAIVFYRKGGKVYAQVEASVISNHKDPTIDHDHNKWIAVCVELGELS